MPIDASVETTAAFVGRALRGPLDTPVLITSFAAFHRRFGGYWSGSSLGTSVEQFFTHGGRQAYVVRVANNARGAMICLPASHGVLVLRAVEPGSTEHIRAAIDYDGIDGEDDTSFNLTLQRVTPDTGLVLDQEIYRRLTCKRGEERSVDDVLMSSSLVRAQDPLPAERPLQTAADYVEPAQAGCDGQPLSDYDLIGSAGRGTGLFALKQVDLLHLPPPEPGSVPGPAAVLAAALYCHKRGAILILDPPDEWKSTYDAIRGTRNAGYANPDVLSYFPRARARDDEHGPQIPIGGAIAGLLSKLDRSMGGPRSIWFRPGRRITAGDRNLQQRRAPAGQGRLECRCWEKPGVHDGMRLGYLGAWYSTWCRTFEPDHTKIVLADHEGHRPVDALGRLRTGCCSGERKDR